jgi:ferredoxin--NADP+ reductase
MVDGTGMCGGCRVSVGGEMKFACVDGPEFDGHHVDFDELIMRNRTYTDLERVSDGHHCAGNGSGKAGALQESSNILKPAEGAGR